MYPDDRVLVGVMPDPADLAIAQEQHWYRIPQGQQKDGIHAEYIAFYFPAKFPEHMRHRIMYFARRTGHELVRRVDIKPDEPDHPRAHNRYYKVQLGPIREKNPPILSLTSWKRITFINTTWDRFTMAHEVNDLFSTDKQFVDRTYHDLKRKGIQPVRNVPITERGVTHQVDMAVRCKRGDVLISSSEERPQNALLITEDEEQNAALINDAINRYGGPLLLDIPI